MFTFYSFGLVLNTLTFGELIGRINKVVHAEIATSHTLNCSVTACLFGCKVFDDWSAFWVSGKRSSQAFHTKRKPGFQTVDVIILLLA